jgi:putative heme iron utilization protein
MNQSDLPSGMSRMQTHARNIRGIPMVKLVFIRKEAKKKFFAVSRSRNRYALYADGIYRV